MLLLLCVSRSPQAATGLPWIIVNQMREEWLDLRQGIPLGRCCQFGGFDRLAVKALYLQRGGCAGRRGETELPERTHVY